MIHDAVGIITPSVPSQLPFALHTREWARRDPVLRQSDWVPLTSREDTHTAPIHSGLTENLDVSLSLDTEWSRPATVDDAPLPVRPIFADFPRFVFRQELFPTTNDCVLLLDTITRRGGRAVYKGEAEEDDIVVVPPPTSLAVGNLTEKTRQTALLTLQATSSDKLAPVSWITTCIASGVATRNTEDIDRIRASLWEDWSRVKVKTKVRVREKEELKDPERYAFVREIVLKWDGGLMKELHRMIETEALASTDPTTRAWGKGVENFVRSNRMRLQACLEASGSTASLKPKKRGAAKTSPDGGKRRRLGTLVKSEILDSEPLSIDCASCPIPGVSSAIRSDALVITTDDQGAETPSQSGVDVFKFTTRDSSPQSTDSPTPTPALAAAQYKTPPTRHRYDLSETPSEIELTTDTAEPVVDTSVALNSGSSSSADIAKPIGAVGDCTTLHPDGMGSMEMLVRVKEEPVTDEVPVSGYHHPSSLARNLEAIVRSDRADRRLYAFPEGFVQAYDRYVCDIGDSDIIETCVKELISSERDMLIGLTEVTGVLQAVLVDCKKKAIHLFSLSPLVDSGRVSLWNEGNINRSLHCQLYIVFLPAERRQPSSGSQRRKRD